MPIFSYSAADNSGKIIEGEREAETERKLAGSLKSEGLLLLGVKDKTKIKSGLNVDIGAFLARLKPVTLEEKMVFTRNLAVMIEAGLSVTKALEALKEETANPKFRTILDDINNTIIKGGSLAEAMRTHQKIFGELFVNMVGAGEASGKLERVLKLMARQMKRDHDLRSRIKGAMMYPSIIVIALVGVGTLMMLYVVPTLAQTIKELGVPLPITTQIVIFISNLLVHYGILVLLTLIAAIFIFYRILKTQKGKATFDAVILRLPIFGSLIKKFNTARFSRTLSYLITSGIPIVRSLEITASVLGNTWYRKALSEAGINIQKGKQLNEILKNYPLLFQPLVIQMIQVGEETGKISSMLLRLALFFEEDVTNSTKNLSTIIEPVLMVIIGVIVGFFAVSMLQPIYGSLGNL